jgi:drug/metabolite transporter (DMT)-like permease
MSKEVLISKNIDLLTRDTDQLAPEETKPTEKPDNPRLGILYFCLSGFIFCLNFMCGKVLYEHHPDLSTTQLLVYRSTISIIMLIIYLNKQIKYIMYNSIDAASVPPLATRVITGNIAIFVNFMAVKFFKLTMVAMVINCAPFVSIFLAGPILGEKITLEGFLSLLFAFAGISLMILGSEGTETRPAYTPNTLAYIALLCNPLCIASGTVAMRAMRKLNDNVVSAYMALLLFVVFLPISLISGENLGLWFSFSIVDWVCIIGISAGTIVSQTLRFMAL